MPELTIVIPTLNRPKVLEETLESLNQASFDVEYEVIICDSSENKKTENVCENFEVTYESISNDTNTSEAKNIGWKSSKTKFIAFVDDDVRFYDGWADCIVENLSEDNVGACGGPAIDIKQRGEPDIIRLDSNQNIIDKGFVKDESHRWIPSNTLEVETLRGANQAYKRKILEETDGFDEKYIGNCFREETDLLHRVKQKGYKILYNPQARLDHISFQTGGTRDKSKEFWYSLGYNQRRFVQKLFYEYRYIHYFKFLLAWNYASYSLSKIVLSSIKNLDFRRMNYLKGFIEGKV